MQMAMGHPGTYETSNAPTAARPGTPHKNVPARSSNSPSENATNAEIAARVSADQALQTALDTQEAKQESDRQASDAAIAQEVQDRTQAVAAEAAARQAAIQGVQNQIASILSNSDPAAIDSLTELVQAYEAGDQTVAAQVSGALTRIAAIEAVLNALVDAGL